MEQATQEVALTPEVRFEKANELIKSRMMWAAGAGLVPVPLFDFAAITALQIDMLRVMAKMYEIPFRKDMVKSILVSLVGGALPVSVVNPAASLIKAIPVIGQTTGAVTMSILGSASTYAVGKVFVRHFDSGGTFLDFDPAKVREYYKQEFEEGKKVASDMKK